MIFSEGVPPLGLLLNLMVQNVNLCTLPTPVTLRRQKQSLVSASFFCAVYELFPLINGRQIVEVSVSKLTLVDIYLTLSAIWALAKAPNVYRVSHA